MKTIYLDNAATTPMDPRVLEAMLPYFNQEFANASSIHYAGSRAMSAVIASKSKIADFLACSADEVIFTSGATESDNLAIFGVLGSILGANKQNNQKPHLLVSAIEHEAVLEPAKHLEKQGVVDLDIIPVNADGLVELSVIKKMIKDNTALISIMYANNEIGVVEPIDKIGVWLEKINQKRSQKIYFHTDATQAVGYLDCSVKKLKVDLLSFSGHKIYGPKGIGVLYLKKGALIKPMIYGGGQEKKIRSGTYNVPAIVGLAEAINILSNTKEKNLEIKRLKAWRDLLIKELLKIPKAKLNGDKKNRLPNSVNIVFLGVEGESIVLMLSKEGIMASTGSACSSGSLDPSHVLLAIGLKPEVAHGSLRLSLGRFNEISDIEAVIKIMPVIIKKLRQISPLK